MIANKALGAKRSGVIQHHVEYSISRVDTSLFFDSDSDSSIEPDSDDSATSESEVCTSMQRAQRVTSVYIVRLERHAGHAS